MKKTSKRVLSIFLSVLMCLTVFMLDWSGLVPSTESATANPEHRWYITLEETGAQSNDMDGSDGSGTVTVTVKTQNGRSSTSTNLTGTSVSIPDKGDGMLSETTVLGTYKDSATTYYPTAVKLSIKIKNNSYSYGGKWVDIKMRLYVFSSIENKFVEAYSGTVRQTSSTAAFGSGSTTKTFSYDCSGGLPVASSVDTPNIAGVATLTLPEWDGSTTTVTGTSTTKVRDQFGVEWTADATSFEITGGLNSNNSQVSLATSSNKPKFTLKAPTSSTTNPYLHSTALQIKAKYGSLTSEASEVTVNPTYKITYNASENGGTLGSSTPATKTQVNDTSTGEVSWDIEDDWTASKNNYVFEGWNTGNGKYDKTDPSATNPNYQPGASGNKAVKTNKLNLTLYAQFSKKVTVARTIYNSAGERKQDTNLSTVYAWNTESSVPVTLPQIDSVTKDGTTYIGVGYAKNASDKTATYSVGDGNTFNVPAGEGAADGDYKVYAIYSGNITLTHNRNASDTNYEGVASGSPENPAAPITVTKTFNVGAANLLKDNDVTAEFTVNPNNYSPKRTRATYTGYWALDSDLDGDDIDDSLETNEAAGYYRTGSTITLAANTTIYAAYIFDPWNVTFYDYDGETVLSEQRIKAGDDAVPPEIQNNVRKDARYHYTFDGWVGGSYENVQKDETLYARYIGYGHIMQTRNVTKAATCTEPGRELQVCTVCGYETNVTTPMIDHSWVVVEGHAATCTEAGAAYRVYCENCNAEYPEDTYVDPVTHEEYHLGDADPALGHNWLMTKDGGEAYADGETLANGMIVHVIGEGEDAYTVFEKPSTCVTHGYSYKVCARCGLQETIDAQLPLTGHAPEDVEGIAPTCTTPGQSGYRVCSVCGELLQAPTALRKLGHDLEYHPAVTNDDDCTKDAVAEYWQCRRCGKYFSAETAKAEDEIETVLDDENNDVTVEEKLTTKGYDDHDYAYVEEKAATCTEDGIEGGGWVCTRCGKARDDGSSTETTVLPALGHDWNEGEHHDAEKPCQEHGYTVYTCVRCGETETVYDEGELAAHTVETTEGKAPTCYAFGETGHEFCTVCGETLTEFSYIPKTAHTYGEEPIAPEVKATCTEAGTTAKYECTVCRAAAEAELIDEADVATTGGVAVPALGHDYTGWTVTKEASCTEAGSRNRRCLRCGEVETEEIEMLGHNIVEVEAKEATCAEEGHTAGEHCTRCDYKTYTVIEKSDHAWGEWEELRAATCAAGKLESRECANCHTIETREGDPLSQHQGLKNLPAVPATCTATGLTAGQICEVCGETITAQTIVPKKDHTPDTENVVNKDATCTEDGVQGEVKCADCGKVLVKGTVLPATGHTYGEFTVVSELTCTQNGVRERVCTKCHGALGEDKYGRPGKQTITIEAQGHVWVTDARVEPTCTATGFTEGKHCANCGLVKIAQEEIPATDHTYSSVTVPATCVNKGYTEYTCIHCGNTYRDNETSALGHTGGTATCVEKAVCTRCGETYGRFGAHNFVADSGNNVPGTCVQRAVFAYKCSVCGETKTETGDFGSHQIGEGDIVRTPATCTEPGTVKATCPLCGEVFVEAEGAPLGHDYQNGVCTRCGAPDPATQGSSECSKCGLNHQGRTGLWKEDGLICKIVAFFRNLFKIFSR